MLNDGNRLRYFVLKDLLNALGVIVHCALGRGIDALNHSGFGGVDRNRNCSASVLLGHPGIEIVSIDVGRPSRDDDRPIRLGGNPIGLGRRSCQVEWVRD